MKNKIIKVFLVGLFFVPTLFCQESIIDPFLELNPANPKDRELIEINIPLVYEAIEKDIENAETQNQIEQAKELERKIISKLSHSLFQEAKADHNNNGNFVEYGESIFNIIDNTASKNKLIKQVFTKQIKTFLNTSPNQYSPNNGRFLKALYKQYLKMKVKQTEAQKTVLFRNAIKEYVNKKSTLSESEKNKLIDFYTKDINNLEQYYITDINNNAQLDRVIANLKSEITSIKTPTDNKHYKTILENKLTVFVQDNTMSNEDQLTILEAVADESSEAIKTAIENSSQFKLLQDNVRKNSTNQNNTEKPKTDAVERNYQTILLERIQKNLETMKNNKKWLQKNETYKKSEKEIEDLIKKYVKSVNNNKQSLTDINDIIDQTLNFKSVLIRRSVRTMVQEIVAGQKVTLLEHLKNFVSRSDRPSVLLAIDQIPETTDNTVKTIETDVEKLSKADTQTDSRKLNTKKPTLLDNNPPNATQTDVITNQNNNNKKDTGNGEKNIGNEHINIVPKTKEQQEKYHDQGYESGEESRSKSEQQTEYGNLPETIKIK